MNPGKGPLDETKILSESTSIFQQASRDHEKTQKLIHTITTLNNECQIDMKESDLSFYFAKHTFKLRFQFIARWRCAPRLSSATSRVVNLFEGLVTNTLHSE